MYKPFELLFKALYVIIFWTIILYVMEIRKFGTTFYSVAIETLMGWGIFAVIATLFAIFISSSHKKASNDSKKNITKNVIEDGMVFTVGGHTLKYPILPDPFLIESEVLKKYKDEHPLAKEASRQYSIKAKQLLNELISTNPDDYQDIDEEALFDAKENDHSDNNEPKSKVKLNKVSTENKYVVSSIKDEYTDDHESRRVDLGLLSYEYHYNLIFSHIVNFDIYQFEADINSGKQTFSKAEYIEKKEKLKREAQVKFEAIEESLAKVLRTLDRFEYRGIVSTTPKIKPRRTFSMKKYQLSIFTALFPFIDWKVLRSLTALNTLDPQIKADISSAELKKLDASELGLSLRDKRILWVARRMYDTYLRRDEDLNAGNKSSCNMPISFDDHGKKYNPLEEPVALCELYREAIKVKQDVVPISKSKAKAKKSEKPYTNSDILRFAIRIMGEKNRFNSSVPQDRIGIYKNGLIYLDFDQFYPKLNGRIAEQFPESANHVEYQVAFNMLYEELKSRNLLAMRILNTDGDKNVERFDHKTNGEFFVVSWNTSSSSGKPLESENMLILHPVGILSQICSKLQDFPSSPMIMGVSESNAVPLSSYYYEIEDKINAAKYQKEREVTKKNIIEEITPSDSRGEATLPVANANSVTEDMNKLLEAESSDQNNKSEVEKIIESSRSSAKQNAPDSDNQDKGQDGDSISPEIDGLADSIISAIQPNQEGIERANKTLNPNMVELEQLEKEDAFKYINQEVQVITLSRKSRKTASKIEYAIVLPDKSVKLIECGRNAINQAAETLDFTILKLLDSLSLNNNRAKFVDQTNSKKKIKISKNKVMSMFNVIEQMALYQKQGDGTFWSIDKQVFKSDIQRSDQDFNMISSIECLTIDSSKEESIYAEIRKNLWNADMAKKLFNEIIQRLDDIPNAELRKLNIRKDDGLYLIPKRNLGQLRRSAVQINSFLTYCDRFKDELPEDLKTYTESLKAIESNGENIIYFNSKGR